MKKLKTKKLLELKIQITISFINECIAVPKHGQCGMLLTDLFLIR